VHIRRRLRITVKRVAANLSFTFLFLYLTAPVTCCAANSLGEALNLGGTVGDYLAFREWNQYWKAANPLQVLHQHGFGWVRVGVLTTNSDILANTDYQDWPQLGWQDEFWCSREYSTRVLKEANECGMDLDVFFFFSDHAVWPGNQGEPAARQSLTLLETANALQTYCYETVSYFRNEGLLPKVYEMGNEIETGICGFYPGGKVPPWNGLAGC